MGVDGPGIILVWVPFRTQEIPTIQQWPFTEDDAHRIQQPALAVLGTASPPMFAERQKLLHWLPNAEPLDLPGLTHLLYVQAPPPSPPAD